VVDGHPAELTRWTIHDERIVDDTRRARLYIAEVELPDGVRFEQYVLRLPRAAMMLVLDDDDRVLMMWRHRFIIDRWVWELPGGYVDETEDPAVTAAREVEEETGWRPRNIEPLLSFQPMVGTADAENLLFLARGADYTGAPVDVNEAERVGWIPLDEVTDYIARGEIVGAASLVGLLDLLASTYWQGVSAASCEPEPGRPASR
jgi:8-oxo-dGTP pyrophosphatase MutT (NUDIX family)